MRGNSESSAQTGSCIISGSTACSACYEDMDICALAMHGEDRDILNIAKDDPQIVINLLQTASQSSRYSAHRQKVHRLLMKLSLRCNKLPTPLFLHGVKFTGGDSYGAGSFADIYKGEWEGRPVALKRLRVFQMLEESKRAQLQRSFYHESLIWRGLNHPNVLSFLGIDDTNFSRSLCMVLPWMNQGNIRNAMDTLKDSLSSSEYILQILKWIHEISSGLAYLHNEGIVHGDLRGANILVDHNRNTKLTDFGLSVFAEATSNNYGSLRGGNARWQSPELIHPEAYGMNSDRPTRASDVFAFGCVCIELCTSQAPYAGMSDHHVIARVPQGLRPHRPIFNDGSPLPEALWSMMNMCWQSEVAYRPTAQLLVEVTRTLLHPQASDSPHVGNTMSLPTLSGAIVERETGQTGHDAVVPILYSMPGLYEHTEDPYINTTIQTRESKFDFAEDQCNQFHVRHPVQDCTEASTTKADFDQYLALHAFEAREHPFHRPPPIPDAPNRSGTPWQDTSLALKDIRSPAIAAGHSKHLTRTQTTMLEEVFSYDPYPSVILKTRLSDELAIPLRHVQIWFQSRRQRDRARSRRLSHAPGPFHAQAFDI